jgi:hypothetical protein
MSATEVKIAIGDPGRVLPSILNNQTMSRQDRKMALRLVI